MDSSPIASNGVGLRISSIEPGGPAAVAGLSPGDVVLAVNGRAAVDSLVISQEIGAADPGDEIELSVLRQGARFNVRAVAGERPKIR